MTIVARIVGSFICFCLSLGCGFKHSVQRTPPCLLFRGSSSLQLLKIEQG